MTERGVMADSLSHGHGLTSVVDAVRHGVAPLYPPERLDQVVDEQTDTGRDRLAWREDRVKLDRRASVIRQNPDQPAGGEVVGDVPEGFRG